MSDNFWGSGFEGGSDDQPPAQAEHAVEQEPDLPAGPTPEQYVRERYEVGPEEAEGYEDDELYYDDEEEAEDPYQRAAEAVVAEQRFEQELADLEAEFPELSTTEGATELIHTARFVAEKLGEPELAEDPRFLRDVHVEGLRQQRYPGPADSDGPDPSGFWEGIAEQQESRDPAARIFGF